MSSSYIAPAAAFFRLPYWYQQIKAERWRIKYGFATVYIKLMRCVEKDVSAVMKELEYWHEQKDEHMSTYEEFYRQVARAAQESRMRSFLKEEWGITRETTYEACGGCVPSTKPMPYSEECIFRFDEEGWEDVELRSL